MWWLAGSLLFPGKLGKGDDDNFGDIDDHGDDFEGDNDIYIMMQCLSVTKNEHFLKRPVCQP